MFRSTQPSLFEQAFSPESMNQAWLRFRNEKAHWQPKVDMDLLKAHFPLHLITLIRQVESDAYRPDRVKQFSLTKGDGSERIIQAQSVRDKYVQRCVLNAIEPVGEALFYNDSFGYRPNRGVEDAVSRTRDRLRQGLEWVVDADIRHFFDSIAHKPLMQQVRRHIKDKKILRLIERWLAEGPHHKSLFGSRRGLAQGSVISPFLTNLYLHQLDDALHKENIPFVRFADDFVLLTQTKEQAHLARHFVSKTLSRLDLALHPDKTKIVHHPNQGLHFLGRYIKPIK
ncbi:reverse transcriptase domain-containing protein [Thiomicrospira microaerophila]|uniref:reverse transcriptase domain-containing protein n=1 Tax=Thiomicrospira microaerophila TaxID=406020 RepID=UPI0005CA8CF1|nr:reverse transcriptase domain-containing protein [Thiomicrospira microaerophila]